MEASVIPVLSVLASKLSVIFWTHQKSNFQKVYHFKTKYFVCHSLRKKIKFLPRKNRSCSSVIMYFGRPTPLPVAGGGPWEDASSASLATWSTIRFADSKLSEITSYSWVEKCSRYCKMSLQRFSNRYCKQPALLLEHLTDVCNLSIRLLKFRTTITRASIPSPLALCIHVRCMQANEHRRGRPFISGKETSYHVGKRKPQRLLYAALNVGYYLVRFNLSFDRFCLSFDRFSLSFDRFCLSFDRFCLSFDRLRISSFGFVLILWSLCFVLSFDFSNSSVDHLVLFFNHSRFSSFVL